MTKKLKGSGGGGGGTGAKDNIFSTDWVEIVLGISEGEIKGIKDNSFKNVFINGTAHTAKDGTKNFANSDFNIAYDVGGASPKPIKYNLGGSSTTVTVGQEMFKGVPVMKVLPNGASTTFNQIEVRIMVEQLVRYDDEGGQTTSVEFKLEIKKDSEGIWKPFQTGKTQYTIPGKTTQGVAYEYVTKLPNVVVLDGSDTYTIRATKLSDNSTDKHYRDLTFAAIDLVNTQGGSQEVHPNLAYVQFYGKLGEQITGVPQITAVWQGLLCSVPSNYNSTTRTYTGTWNGTFKSVKEFTNNPFWVIREMALNPRFGLASALKYLSVNDYEIYDLAKHADEPVAAGLNGEKQPRFTFNGVLDKPMDGVELLNYIAGSAFARCYDDMQGQLRIIADRNDASVMLIVPESVISQNESTFSYTKMDLRKRSNYITATYIDPDMNWQSQELVIKDDAAIDRFGLIQSQQQLIGCTDRHEAYRKLKYLLTTGLTEIISVSFTMPMSGIMLKPYDVVDIADPDMGWALTGRIWSIAGKVLSLRDPLTFDSAGTYTIRVQSASAGVITRTITIAQAGVYNSLTMNATITETLNQFSPFSIESPSNIGLSKPFRILRIDEVSGRPDVYSVTAIELNRNKFGDSDNAILTDGAIPAPEYGFKAPIKLDPVTDIVASNTRNKFHKLVDLYVTWTDGNVGIFNRSYVVTIRKEGKESWSRTFTTTTPWLEVEAIPVGELSISVQLQCSMGKVNSEVLVFLSSYLSSEVIDLDWAAAGSSTIVGGYDSSGDLVFQTSMSYIQQSVSLNLLLEPTIRNLRAHIFNGATEVTSVDSTDGNFRLPLSQNMASNGGLAIDNLKVNISAIDINGTETSTLATKTFIRDGIPDIEGIIVTPKPYGCQATILYDEYQEFPPIARWYVKLTSGAGYSASDLVSISPSLNLGSLLANTTYYLWVEIEGPYGDYYPKNNIGTQFTTPVVTSTSLGVDLEKTVYTYLRSATKPATPLGGTFTAPMANTNINPWSAAIPADNGLPLWVASRTFYLGGAATTWSVPYTTTAPNWLNGTGAPAGALGTVLDNYLDTVSGDIYRKTGAAVWTLIGNIRGSDGDAWHSSNGVPSGSLGAIGDFCLNTVNGDVYTKTGATTWTLTGNIKGVKGDNGTAGAVWLNGSANPATGLGVVGDFYLNTTSGDTFKKTAAAVWTLQGNIKGGDGDKWHSGTGVPAGVLGTVGDHYLNTATWDVYDKTGATTWVLTGNIKGGKGDTGTAGAVWLTGTVNPATGLGAINDFYLNTASGDTFKKTAAAVWTLQGNIKGGDGDKWLSGAGVPAGALGTIGDHYLDTVSGDVYDKTGATAWTLTGNIKGAKGDTGTAGAVWHSGAVAPATGLGVIGDFYLNTASGDTFKKTAAAVWTLQGNIRGGDGDKWLSGTAVPSGAIGVIGDHYLNTTNWDVYDKTGATTWTLTGNIKGSKGDTGTAGSVWLNGSANPTTGVGAIGDFYLNTTSGDTFKKTGAAAWTLQGNIRGGDGDKWHSGAGAPATGLGTIGDHYLNTSTWDVYDKTAAAVWTLTGNIKGLKGDKGDTGTAGAVWLSGTANPATGLGSINDFYLNTASGDTFKKTAATVWTLQGNIKGGDGDKWHSGTTAPSSGLGTIGDHYLNTTNWDVYDKTGATTWTLTGNIKGAQGEDANFFDPTFSKGLNFWSQTITGAVPPNLDNSPGISIVPTGVKGGNSLRLASAKTICSRYPIAIDPNKVYRVKARVRQITAPTVGGSSFFLGVVCLNENYQYFAEGVGTYRYAGAQGAVLNVANGWVEFSGLITGNVNNNHNTFKTYTKYVRPVVIVNNAGGNGVVEVDYIDFYEVIGADDLLVGGGWSQLPVEPTDPRISNGFLQDQFKGANLAKTATFTSNQAIATPAALTDGNVSIGSGFAGMGANAVYLQADLGQVRFLSQSWAYFYAADGRRYNCSLATSIDGVTWEWVTGTGSAAGAVATYDQSRAATGNFYPVGAELPTIVGIFAFARYVRLYMNGNTANTSNHLYEWELWSSVPRPDPYPEQVATGLVTPLTTIPLAPAITSVALAANRSINITVATVANDKAGTYEIWRSVGNTTSWVLIHTVAKADVANGGSFVFNDDSYQKRAAIYYRAYAVNRDTYSGAGTNTFNVATDIPDPTNVTVAAGSFEYSLTWVNTTDNLLKSVEVRVQALATQSGFAIGNSTVVYNGLGTSFTYEVPVGDRSKYHQFWLSSIEKT